MVCQGSKFAQSVGETVCKRGWGRGCNKGTVSLQMITVVSVGEQQHVLQNLDQCLYLFSFLDIVQPDYQLLQSFFVLLLAPLTAATGHDGPCSQQAAPPAPRPSAQGRGSGAGHCSRAEHGSQPAARATRPPHPYPRPPVYEEGGGSPPGAVLPALSPPPLLPPAQPRPKNELSGLREAPQGKALCRTLAGGRDAA